MNDSLYKRIAKLDDKFYSHGARTDDALDELILLVRELAGEVEHLQGRVEDLENENNAV